MVALDDEQKISKEPAVLKPSSDMTMSLFKYEEVKSEEAFDGASMHMLPKIIPKFEHKSVQCDPPIEKRETEKFAEEQSKQAIDIHMHQTDGVEKQPTMEKFLMTLRQRSVEKKKLPQHEEKFSDKVAAK